MRLRSLLLVLLLVSSTALAACYTRVSRGGGRGGGGGGDDDDAVANDDDAVGDDDDAVGDDDDAVGDDDDTAGNVDTDGDGLSDAEEASLGTSPTNPDTDGDGYLDGWEVAEGTNPLSASSVIYEGGWPYNPDKDSMSAGSWGIGANVGQRFPRWMVQDQFGDLVDFYDLANAGVPIVIDVSAVWCGPCNQLADWLDGANNGMVAGAEAIREAVWAHEIIWVTAIYEDGTGSPADASDVGGWYSAYPTEGVLVAPDGAGQVVSLVNPPGIPSLSLLNPDMSFAIVDETNAVLNALLNQL
jgi:predicted small secreted protein